MINRYESDVIKQIWSELNKINTWRKIELSYVNALFKFRSHLNIENFTQNDLNVINSSIKHDLDESDLNAMLKYENETKHDFLSFLMMLEDKIPNKSGRWLHYGLTSSDILDTQSMMFCVESLRQVQLETAKTIYILHRLIKSDDAETEILARTHGQAAEIQLVSNVYSRWLETLRSSYDSMTLTIKTIKQGKLSGAVGNHKINCIGVEGLALSEFGFQAFKNASQIISRDLYLDYMYALLKVILFIEKVASDIRYYSQSEIKEICEGFSKGQKGSSAMPHKKNPIMCENLTGLARLAKGYMQVAIDNCQTQLERDISHSSSERIIFEDMAHLTHFGLIRLNDVLTNLVVNKDNCKYNIDKNRTKLDSQKMLSDFIKQGYSRKESHDLVQKEIEKGESICSK